MARVLVRSANKRWWLSKRVAEKESFDVHSERGLLLSLIQAGPGVSTEALMRCKAVPAKLVPRIPSRLTELERSGLLVSSFNGDLFRHDPP